MKRERKFRLAFWATMWTAVMIVLGYTASSARADVLIDFDNYNLGDLTAAGQPHQWDFLFGATGAINIIDIGGGNLVVDQTSGIAASHAKMTNLQTLEPGIADGTTFSIDVVTGLGPNGETPAGVWGIDELNGAWTYGGIGFEGSGINAVVTVERALFGQTWQGPYTIGTNMRFATTLDITNLTHDVVITNLDTNTVMYELFDVPMQDTQYGPPSTPGPAGVKETFFKTYSFNGGMIIYDNFRITLIPEPASLTLLGLGGLMLLRRHRRPWGACRAI